MSLALVQAGVGSAPHIGVEEPVDDEEGTFDPYLATFKCASDIADLSKVVSGIILTIRPFCPAHIRRYGLVSDRRRSGSQHCDVVTL